MLNAVTVRYLLFIYIFGFNHRLETIYDRDNDKEQSKKEVLTKTSVWRVLLQRGKKMRHMIGFS